MNENKTNINWLITIYSNFLEKPLFIRVCDKLYLNIIKNS